MHTGIYKIADHVFRVNSIHAGIHEMSRNYVSAMEPEFEISTSQPDIDTEREESLRTAEKEGLSADYEYTDSYLETLAVYRKLCRELLDKDILLVHGSCLAINGEACLFVASSGTGKSTHTRNWRKAFGDRVLMVNDDKPLVNVATMQIYGTPWDGKHHISNNVSFQLTSVIEVTRAAQNSIRKVDSAEMLQRMMGQTYMPADGMMKLKTLRLLSALMAKARFYQLACNRDEESARVAYNGIFG